MYSGWHINALIYLAMFLDMILRFEVEFVWYCDGNFWGGIFFGVIINWGVVCRAWFC